MMRSCMNLARDLGWQENLSAYFQAKINAGKQEQLMAYRLASAGHKSLTISFVIPPSVSLHMLYNSSKN